MNFHVAGGLAREKRMRPASDKNAPHCHHVRCGLWAWIACGGADSLGYLEVKVTETLKKFFSRLTEASNQNCLAWYCPSAKQPKAVFRIGRE